jgi:hypothetical protein
MHSQALEEKADGFFILRENSLLLHEAIYVPTGQSHLEYCFTLGGHSLSHHWRQLQNRLKYGASDFLEIILKHELSFADQLIVIRQQLAKTARRQYSGSIVGSFFFHEAKVHIFVVNIVVCSIGLLADTDKKFTSNQLCQLLIFFFLLNGFQKVRKFVCGEG